ncbi:leucine-rich repeat-containing protein 71 isoform X3 [Polypterus senegalus]|uniref:leucine-rich repeat-containing protein 71 isoform X3 n=1 Tax=Polypterus senegalus TaxID=55291 RepID=UPI0019656035|nr:leucine-rich repeat-containing protein 71 isoform X3 [Polypterus senegalus]
MAGHISWKRVIRKVEMGRKVEKVLKDKGDKGAPVSEEDGTRTAASKLQEKSALQTIEDYQCTGILENDFPELCNLIDMKEFPLVTPRPRPTVTSAIDKSVLEEGQSQTSLLGSPACPSDSFLYFRPRLQVELESDDPKSVREVHIRGWKIDDRMIRVFNKCLPSLSSLQGIKKVVLEGTPIPSQAYALLISEESVLTHLSLRNNKIDEVGAKLIGQALSTPKLANKNLTSLNLAYNHIEDAGALYIAKGLRLNRALLCLNLSHNQIGDQGAMKLAEVLGPFALTHEEVVERRILLLSKDSQDGPKSPLFARRADLKGERSLSHSSSISIDRNQKTKSAAKKKDKESPKKDEKAGAGGANAGGGTAGAQGGAATKKDESKGGKKGTDTKASKAKGAKSGEKEKRPLTTEQEACEQLEIISPLLDVVEHRSGNIFLPGNNMLASLNLMGNQITEISLQAFLTVLLSQSDIPKGRPGTGLLRLAVTRNNFSPKCEVFLKINEILSKRDPLSKTALKSEGE